MIYFTADLHFYHEKIIKHTKRPYHTVDEMNKSLIKRWNDKISYDDEVYILGDFTLKGAEAASAILYSLKGKKHLIRGNHDCFVDSGGFDRSLFASVQDYMELTCQNTQFVLFHYPILEWHGFGKGAVMLHGHQHNHKEYNIDNKKSSILRYDVGVDANDMSSVSMEELIAFLFS
ncbi:MAG: hydrolase [Lachnospiraceae bacterium]|nr:hydrolase [Lachnospiraceae bacterium]